MRIRRVKVVQTLKWLIICVPTIIAVAHFFKLHEKIKARRERLHVDRSNHSITSCVSLQPEMEPTPNTFYPFVVKNTTFLLFNAYLDNRKALNGHSTIRILAYVSKFNFTAEIYCQFWHDRQTAPKVSKVTDMRLIWRQKWQQNQAGLSPFLLSCEVDPKDPPHYVSLVESPCDTPISKLSVINDASERKRDFLVCVKGMQFYDIKMALILVEWIEIVKLLGADKIVFYVLDTSDQIMQVLRHYESRQLAEVIHLHFPVQNLTRSEDFLQTMMHDLIAYNDCLYRHVNGFNYIVPMDVDEFIMPVVADSWMELLKRSESASRRLYQNDTFDGFIYPNAFFILANNHAGEIQPEVPENFHFLQHIYRAVNRNENAKHAKGFMNISRVITVHNHSPLECFENGKCKSFLGSGGVGQVQHYREKCESYKECDDYTNNTVRDDNLWRFKDEIVGRVSGAVREVFGDDSLFD